MFQNEARAGQDYSSFRASTHFTSKREHMQNAFLQRVVGTFQNLCPSFACLQDSVKAEEISALSSSLLLQSVPRPL